MTLPPEPDRWTIDLANAQRMEAIAAFGFTERQARFLLNVLLHSGVFVERQYCSFAGIVHGQKSTDFIKALVERRFATPISTGKLHRGRMFHVHYKPLWAAIGEPDNRFRKPTAQGRMIERVMLLDAVLDDREFTWLGPSMDKRRHFIRHLGDRLELRDYPHLLFGDGPEKTVRYFPDKLPIGMQPHADTHVFVYLVTRPSPMDFRLFLLRHVPLLRVLFRWTVRLLLPRQAREGQTGLSARRPRAARDTLDTLRSWRRWSGCSPNGSGSPNRAPRLLTPATSTPPAPSARRGIELSTNSGWTIPGTRSGWPVRLSWPTPSTANTDGLSASSSRDSTCISPPWLTSPESTAEDDLGDDLGNRGCPPERVRDDPPTATTRATDLPPAPPITDSLAASSTVSGATPARWAAFFAAHCAGTGAAIRAGNHGVSDPGARAGNGPARVRRGRSRHGCLCRCRCWESRRPCPQRR